MGVWHENGKGGSRAPRACGHKNYIGWYVYPILRWYHSPVARNVINPEWNSIAILLAVRIKNKIYVWNRTWSTRTIHTIHTTLWDGIHKRVLRLSKCLSIRHPLLTLVASKGCRMLKHLLNLKTRFMNTVLWSYEQYKIIVQWKLDGNMPNLRNKSQQAKFWYEPLFGRYKTICQKSPSIRLPLKNLTEGSKKTERLFANISLSSSFTTKNSYYKIYTLGNSLQKKVVWVFFVGVIVFVYVGLASFDPHTCDKGTRKFKKIMKTKYVGDVLSTTQFCLTSNSLQEGAIIDP